MDVSIEHSWQVEVRVTANDYAQPLLRPICSTAGCCETAYYKWEGHDKCAGCCMAPANYAFDKWKTAEEQEQDRQRAKANTQSTLYREAYEKRKSIFQ